MKKPAYGQTVEPKKVVAIGVLFLTSLAIMFLGASMVLYSLTNHISYQVLHSEIHGAVFGAVITFLGVRYFLSVRQLKTEVFKATARFSWDNFKKRK